MKDRGRGIFFTTLLFAVVVCLLSCSSGSKKASCPAYDNFAADNQNLKEGEEAKPPKIKKRKRSKKKKEKGLYSKKYKDNFKPYKPPKK